MQGSVYEMASVEHAERLAAYETNSYAPRACELRFGECGASEYDEGICFMFVGNTGDLRDGQFDLGKWLKQQK